MLNRRKKASSTKSVGEPLSKMNLNRPFSGENIKSKRFAKSNCLCVEGGNDLVAFIENNYKRP